MAGPPDPTQKANIRSYWTAQLERMRQYAERDWKAMQHEGQMMWYMPEPKGWSKDLFDLIGMHLPYLRIEHEMDFEAIMASGDSAGRAGDLMITQLQGDWLASLERAFRERHKTWPRMQCQENCRRFGHRHDKGIFQRGMKDYLQFIVKHTGGDNPAPPPSGSDPPDPWGNA